MTPPMEFLLAEEARTHARNIMSADGTKELQACRAFHIVQIAQFICKHTRLSPDARCGLAYLMERPLDVAAPYANLSSGDMRDILEQIAGQ